MLSTSQVQEFVEGIQFAADADTDLSIAEQVAANTYDDLDALKVACISHAESKFAKKIAKMKLPLVLDAMSFEEKKVVLNNLSEALSAKGLYPKLGIGETDTTIHAQMGLGYKVSDAERIYRIAEKMGIYDVDISGMSSVFDKKTDNFYTV